MEQIMISEHGTLYWKRTDENRSSYQENPVELFKINKEQLEKERIRQEKLRILLSNRRELIPNPLFDLSPNKKKRRKRRYDREIPYELFGKTAYWF